MLIVARIAGMGSTEKINSSQPIDITIGQFNNPPQCDNKSVGMLVFNTADQNNPRMLLIQRMKTPFGFAPPAGHLDGDVTYEIAAVRELDEEVGLKTDGLTEITRRRKNFPCRRLNGNYHLWRVFNVDVTGNPKRSLEETQSMNWYSKKDILELADRTRRYRNGEITEIEWKANPGLEGVWEELFQQIGILPDELQSQRGKIPPFIYGRIPLIGRYYDDEYEQTQAAAHAFERIGMATYPKPKAENVKIISESGDTFNFLGGSKLSVAPYQAQLGFFREIRRANDIPMVNNFVYVAVQDGYLGRTASIEVAYSMANKKRVIFSEYPSKYSHELPEAIVSIVENNYDKYPVLPIDKIDTHLSEAINYKIEQPNISENQRASTFNALLTLIRDLKMKFGSQIEG